jgi:hypothetical protein
LLRRNPVPGRFIVTTAGDGPLCPGAQTSQSGVDVKLGPFGRAAGGREREFPGYVPMSDMSLDWGVFDYAAIALFVGAPGLAGP